MNWNVEQVLEDLEACLAQGYRTIKIRVGADQQIADEGIIRAQKIAEGIRNRAKLCVDAGQQIFCQAFWSLADAAKLVDALSELNVEFLEDLLLIHDLEGYRSLKRLGKVPIAGGEMFNAASQFQTYIQAQALDVAQPDASVLSGPQSCLRLGQYAEQQRVRVVMHSFAGPVAQMQNIHAALAIPACDLVEFATLYHPMVSEVLEPIWRFENGQLHAPSTPGMGISIAPAIEGKYPYQNVVSLIA